MSHKEKGMSRRSQRLSQNAASLIRPAAVVHVCADCGRYAKPCYDLQGEKAGDYCAPHAHQRGFCTACGNERTETEKQGGGNLCGACRLPRYYADGTFDGDYPEGDDEYEL
jgi:hypothetical protein